VIKLYTKDKAQRITLRLSDKQFSFVRATADTLGVSPSDFLRMVINTVMCSQNPSCGGLGRENDKTDINDLV
jgi:predicted DNA binding CopG/RHH family protein